MLSKKVEQAAATSFTSSTTNLDSAIEEAYYCSCGKRFRSWSSLRAHVANTRYEMPPEFKKQDVVEGVEKPKTIIGEEQPPIIPSEKDALIDFLNPFASKNRKRLKILRLAWL